MKQKLFLLTLSALFFASQLLAQIPEGYYDNATGTGYTLKTQLYQIIKDHNVHSYTNLWIDFQYTDVDDIYENDGSVLDMYSENPSGSDTYNYIFVTDQCGNYSGEGSCYNREHSFPKSWFDDASPMYTDLFHIYPTDGYVNGRRSNYPYGEVGSASWTSSNGSKLGTCSYPGYSGTVFEPIDEFKGDFARTYFYMATRYENIISSWPGSDMLDGSSQQVFTTWALSMLIKWHQNDPVSTKEINRNNAVYNIQQNRNPFIDHPEFVSAIWGGSSITGKSHKTAHIYPNPASTIIRITDVQKITLVSVLNIIGKTVLQITNPDSDIDIAALPKGQYIVVVTTKNNTQAYPLIIAE